MKGCVVVIRDEKIESSTYSWVQVDIVKKVLQNMPQDETLYDLAELFKVFGDSGRIKILYALFEAELCVGDIAQLLGLTQTAVSHQLRILKANKLVKARKDGKNVFYSLSDNHVYSIINQGMEHVNE
jgi:DNA-binding transcriptional ArsR family regulator